MAATVIWTNEALDDIDSIAEYISRDSLYHAQSVVESIFNLGDSLPEQPEAGRMVPELQSPDVRERFIYSYRLMIRPLLPTFPYRLALTTNFHTCTGSMTLENLLNTCDSAI